MSDEQTLDAAEISRRIVTGVGLVYDLLNELHGLFRMVLDQLRSSDLEFDVITGKFFRMPVARGKARTPADTSMPLDRGLILELSVSGNEDENEEDEDDLDDAEESETTSEKRGQQVTPDSQFLVIRAILYDPDKVTKGDFVPAMVAATLGKLEHVPKGKRAQEKKSETTFTVNRGKLLQLAKSLDVAVSEGQKLSFRGGGYQLVGTATGVASRPLAEFDSEESVDVFVQQLVQMAESASS